MQDGTEEIMDPRQPADADEDIREFFDSLQEDGQEEHAAHGRCVAGVYEDEMEMSASPDRSDYSNWEVNEYLDNYFRFFGSRDMDVIYLYILSKKRQEEIQEILGKSQPAVSYNVTRIRNQMEFVARMMSSIDDFIMFITDPENGMRTFDKELLVIFFYSTSIVKTARIMGIKNVTCRSRLNTVVNHLLQDGHMEMYRLFRFVMDNLNNIKKYVARGEDGFDAYD